MNRVRTLLSLILLFVSMSLAVPSAKADTFEWTNANSGEFLKPANWTNTTGVDPAPPNIGDVALFNEPGAYSVLLTADASLDALDFDAGTISFESSGSPRTYNMLTGAADAVINGVDVTLDATNFNVGSGLSVVNGTLMVESTGDVTVGGATSIATSTGDAEVTFNNSTFEFAGLVRMGLSGFNATLNLENGSDGFIGGDLDFARSGTLGSGGFLNVESGSTLTTNSRILLGDILTNGAPFYNTFITVDDATITMKGANILRVGDSQFDNVNAELKVRNNGTFSTGTGSSIVQRTGLLTIESGGIFNAQGTLAITQGATLTLDGGSLNAMQGLDVSDGVLDFLDGMLTVTGGAFLPNAGGGYTINGPTVAELPHLVIGDGASANFGGALTVGAVNRGELTIEDGGTVSSAGDGTIGDSPNSTGMVSVDGSDGGGNPSTWTNNGSLYIGRIGDGTLNINGGGLVSNTTGIVGGGGNGTSTVTVIGSDSDGNPSTWSNSGNLTVGSSSNGSLNIGDGGLVTNAGGNIGLSGTGMVTVDGTDSDGNPSTWNSSERLSVGIFDIGTLSIRNGGQVSSPLGDIGEAFTLFRSKVTVDGTDLNDNPSAWTMTGQLRIGYSGGNGELEITGGGAVSNVNGAIGVDSGSLGIVTVDGTDSSGNPSLWTNSSFLRIGELGTGTLNITGGGATSSEHARIGDGVDSIGTVIVSGADELGNPSTWTNSGSLYVANSGFGTLSIVGGATVSNDWATIGQDTDSTGVVTVEGSGSSWENSSFLIVGENGTGTLDISAGGTVSNAAGSIGFDTDATGSATVVGEGSTWTNSSLDVGGTSSGAGGDGTLAVRDQGLVEVSGLLKIWGPGTVTLDGGSIATDSWNHSSNGTFNFIAGSLTIATTFVVGTTGTNGQNLTLGFDQTLDAGTTTVQAGRTLRLDGGTLVTGNFNVNGTFSFQEGTLEIDGGTITGLASLSIPSQGEFRVQGTHALRVSGSSDSLITATGFLTLGDATAANGFYSNGRLDVGSHTVTLNDSNDVVFDSGAYVTLGNGSAGTLVAPNGITLDFGGNIAGFGTIDTPDDPAKPLINNGHIAGNSLSDPTEPITLTGYVKGVGTLDNVIITGTDAPGFSPATVIRGSVVYDGTLEIELGGTGVGDFDQINHLLGAGVAQLGGILDVAFLNSFMPSLDDAFEIITALGGVSGTFTTLAEELPALASGLEWEINYGANNVVLEVVSAGLPGDYNNDGLVNAADYVLWRDSMSDDAAGYVAWHSNFGATSGSGANQTAVPEPVSLVLALLCPLSVLHFRAANRRRRERGAETNKRSHSTVRRIFLAAFPLFRFCTLFIGMLAAILGASKSALAVGYEFELLAENAGSYPSINDSGEVALLQYFSDTQRQVARVGQPGEMNVILEAIGFSATGSQLRFIEIPSSENFIHINDSGDIALVATTSNGQSALFVNDQIVAERDANISSIMDTTVPIVTNDGSVYFTASFFSAGAFDLPDGIVKLSGGTLTAPFALDIGGSMFNNELYNLRADDNNQVYAVRQLDERPAIVAETAPDQVIIGEANFFPARTGHPLPDGKELLVLRNYVVNDTGEFAFSGNVEGNEFGIWAGTPNNLRTVYFGPSNGAYRVVSMNDNGNVLYNVGFNEVILNSGIENTSIIKVGDELFGSTVQLLNIGPQALNDDDQVVFNAHLSSGMIVSAIANPIGDTVAWDNPTGGTYDFDANWNPLGAPTRFDKPEFALQNTYTVNLTSNERSGDFSFTDGDVTMNLAGNTLKMNSLRARKTGGGGSLTFQNGTIEIANAPPILIGGGPSPNDAVFLENGAHLGLGGKLLLGSESALADQFSVTGGSTATVDGIEIGSVPGGESFLFVEGPLSQVVTNEDIVVGNAGMAGTAAAMVGPGGTVVVAFDHDTRLNRGVISITGNTQAAQWNNTSGDLDLIEGQFQVFGAQASASFKNVSVAGLEDGSTIAMVQIDGGATMNVGENMVIGSGDSMSFDSVFLSDPDTKLNVGTSLRVEANGLLSGVGTVNAPMIVCFGIMSPGLSPGELILNGSYEQPVGGQLVLEIGGTDAGINHDLLTILGDATIEGAIVLQFIDGFAPQQGQAFDLLAVAGQADLSGATFEVRNLAPGFQFDISPSPGGIVMTALNDGQFSPPGDYNYDGLVNAADYVRWRDADVTPEGYAEWRGNFGAGAGTGSFETAAVPEPGSLELLILGLLLLGGRTAGPRLLAIA